MIKRFLVVFWYGISFGLCWRPSRREILRNNWFTTTAGVMVTYGSMVATTTDSAWAARGAAELDLEYYMRDIIGGNKQEGNIQASLPPVVQPPRVLGEPISRILLKDDFASGCLAVDVLVQTVTSRTPKGTRQKNDVLEEIQAKARSFRDKASRSFYARAPWQRESVTDQYYFDLSAYALWRTAAEFLPKYTNRDVFVRNLGRELYQQMIKEGLVTPSQRISGVVGTVERVREILDVFTQSNFCKFYYLGPDEPAESIKGNKKKKSDPSREPLLIVDELDDEALMSGGSVDFLVSILEPATLGGALQITGEQSRFAPDIVGPTLAAMWEETANLLCSWEILFVDQVYRPNPKDYFPNEQLFQYTLTQDQGNK